MSYLLDTCVISELASKRPDPAVVRWIDGVDPERVYLSVITIGEIRKGIEKVRDPGRKESLAAWLRDELLVRFRDRLSPLDVEVLLEWGVLMGGWRLWADLCPRWIPCSPRRSTTVSCS